MHSLIVHPPQKSQLPMGRCFFKMMESPSTKISSLVSVSRRMLVRSSLGRTMRPSASMPRTMPVLFHNKVSFQRCGPPQLPGVCRCNDSWCEFAAPSKGWDGGLTGDGSDIDLPACVWEERRKQKIRPGNLFHRIYDYYTYFTDIVNTRNSFGKCFSFYGYNGKYSREIKVHPGFPFFCKFLSKYGLKAQRGAGFSTQRTGLVEKRFPFCAFGASR